MNNKKCAVVVPIYRKPTVTESLSLVYLRKHLRNYDLCLVKPKSLEFLLDSFICYNFDDSYFKSIKDYARLMVDIEFYQAFIQYKYILIYQLDCLVFSDRLQYFCDKEYDYIAPPFFASSEEGGWPKSDIVGCGGFSLRKVFTFIKVIRKLENLPNEKANLKYLIDQYSAEDIFWGVHASKILTSFTVSTIEDAIAFGFNENPSIYFDRNNKQLPFGCHAYNKGYKFYFFNKDFTVIDYQYFYLYVCIALQNLFLLLRKKLGYLKKHFLSIVQKII